LSKIPVYLGSGAAFKRVFFAAFLRQGYLSDKHMKNLIRVSLQAQIGDYYSPQKRSINHLNHIEVIEKFSLSKGGDQRSPIEGVKFAVLCFW
jgi:hypothetical protein